MLPSPQRDGTSVEGGDVFVGGGDPQQSFLLSPGDSNTPLPRVDSQTFNGSADAGSVPGNMYVPASDVHMGWRPRVCARLHDS